MEIKEDRLKQKRTTKIEENEKTDRNRINRKEHNKTKQKY